MNHAIFVLNRVSTAWLGVAWAVAWQAVVVVAVFGGVAWLCRRASPALRCWVWQVAALKLLVMPFWGIPLVWTRPPSASPVSPVAALAVPGREEVVPRPGSGRIDTVTPRPTVTPVEARTPIAWPSGLFVAWVMLVGGQVFGLVRQRGQLVRLVGRATPATDPALLTLVADLAGRVGLARPPTVRLLDGDGSPFVCQFRGPSLVLPAETLRHLPPESRRAVILHELAHLQRRDLLWGWLPTLARLLYVIHPASHYVAFRVRLERELACDQTAMLLADQGAAGYAATLVEVVTRASRPSLVRAASALSLVEVPRS